MRDGVLKGGLNFKEPIIKVGPGAVVIKEGAFKGPAIRVEPKAVNLQIASGAIQFHENSININLTGKKSPHIDTEKIKEQLSKLGMLGNIQNLPQELRDKILNNEAVYQATIKALMEVIEKYNKKYAAPTKENK